ncbi:serine/threonine protein kinase [Pedobacter insulae]|uniref:Serine/threonine protein kinase n=1 Tax=Pedobacter insulae TaxID=414048 RepID=A0A1I2WWM6_9SPHI|nr:serine/threonine-protein kinase [Pedobacter insulae]SFH05718.1 serine/threonine protein kinase [Pedobacter insulae]
MSKVFTITEGLENLGALRTGGQGSVYKGKRTGTIYTAVKLIPTPISAEDQNDKNYRNFKNEVAKLQKVNENPSPNVVKILSSGLTESGSFPFIEMEFIEGPDLCELLKPPHAPIFTIKELVKVAGQLAAALAHCHQVGVKHGDIKSNNVKYNHHTGNYVLLDFGLAIMTEEQRRSSIRHAGAIEFMAPEQNSGEMLTQTDVYSYGIILYELLAGQVPFPLKGNSDTARNTVMVSHMENELPDMLMLRRANLPDSWSKEQQEQEMMLPLWLLDFINTCLQKNPEARFKDGIALQNAFIAGTLSATPPVQIENVVAEAPSTGVRLSTFVFALMVVALLGLSTYAAYLTFLKPAPDITNIEQHARQQLLDSLETVRQDSIEQEQQVAIPKPVAIDTPIKTQEKIKKDTVDTAENLTPDTSLSPESI